MSESAGSVRVVHGDLTEQDVDVVVNAANEQLAHGGGVAAALVRAGGRVVQEESNDWIRRNGPLTSGSAAITRAGALPAGWIVHVVGPRYRRGGNNVELLRAAVSAALAATAEIGARTVAMPAISAGIFGYPLEEATAVIADACRRWLDGHPGAIDEVRLVGYDTATVAAFEKAVS